MLGTFSRTELRDFDAWCSSGIHKMNPATLLLARHLSGHLAAADVVSLKKERVVEQVFGGLLDDQKWYDHLSGVRKLIMRFLLYADMISDSERHNHRFLKLLRERQLGQAFEKASRKHQKTLEKMPYRNDEQALLAYRHADEQDHHFLMQQSRDQSDYLGRKNTSLDTFYIISKLRIACEQLNRARIVQGDGHDDLAALLVAHILENRQLFASEPAIGVYVNIYQCLTQDSDEAFDELVDTIQQHYASFPPKETKGIFHHAQNFCIRRINRGEHAYLQRIFELYQFQLERGLIYEGAHINQWDYKNIATVGTRLGRFDWVRNFLHDFGKKLAPGLADNAFNFNLASFYFETGQYSEALILLQQVYFTDVYYQLGSRCILLKVYYEQTDVEGLLALIRSFKSFLQRNKTVSDTQRELHLNLLRFTKKCQQLYDDKPRSVTAAYKRKVSALKQQVETKNITNKQWLLRKVEELVHA